MAFTKITNAGFGLTTGTLVGVAASFSSTVSVGGTLTYEDVTNVDSVGLITARSGISITGGDLTVPDAIIHTDDTNTRIRFPTADTFSVETAGNERLRVDSNGRLLIDTSASQGKWNNSSGDDHIVQIESTSAFSQSWISHSTSATAGVQLDVGRSRGSSDGDTTVVNNGDLLGHLCFQGADGSQFVRGARISATVNGTPGADDMPTDLVFETNSGTTNSSERLRITSAGKMGLGTNSPSQNLHIYQATGDDVGIRIQNSDGFAELEVDADELNYNADSHVFNNQADSAERMRIDSSGNVKIGTRTSQYSFLTPSSGNLQIDGGILFEPGSGNDVEIFNYRTTNLTFGTGGTERLRIAGDGPHLLLGGVADVNEITESSSNTGMVIGSTSVGNGGLAIINSTTGTGRIYFGDATGSNAARNRGQINYYHSGDYMMFATAATERMRIDSSGRLMLGTSTTASLAFTVFNDTNSAINFQNSNTGTGSGNGFYVGTESNTTAYVWNYESAPLTFATANSERMRLDSSGRLLIGATTARSPGGIQASLQVEGTGAVDSSITMVRNSNDINPSYLILGKSRGTSNNSNTSVAGGDNIGSIQWAAADGADIGSTAAYITCSVDGSTGTNDVPGRLVIGTTPDGSNSPTERLRIDSAGVVQIKQSATSNIFRIQNTTSSESSMLIQNSTTGFNAGNGLYLGIGSDETSYLWAYHNENMNFATNNTTRMTIFAGGKIRAPGVYAGTTTGGSAVYVESDGDLLRYTSSLKYKTDVETIEDAKADAILNCRPVWYRSKCANDIKTEGSEKSDWGWYGFIAEEVAEIEPRLVNWATKDAVRQEDGNVESVERDPANYEAEGIRYDNFVPLLVNLAKRQKAQIDALEARISALEG